MGQVNAFRRVTNVLTYILNIFVVPFIVLVSWVIFLPFFFYRNMVIAYVRIFKKDFGKILSGISSILEEDYWLDNPKYIITTTLTMKQKLSIEKIRQIFNRNVLSQPNYREMKQYQTDFMGYRFWKDDCTFKIEDHIYQKRYSNCIDFNLETVHEEMINKPFHPSRSPWELILLNLEDLNVESVDSGKHVLVFRIHHSMADGKSIIKLLVESLGQHNLTTASALYEKRSWQREVLFYILFPFELIKLVFLWRQAQLSSFGHPWRFNSSNQPEEQTRLFVAISPAIPMTQIRSIAKKREVRVSSVIMCIVTAAIRKTKNTLCIRDVHGVMPLPKENHPDILTNHMHMASLLLPTGEPSTCKRLKLCDQTFNFIKSSDLPRYTNYYVYQVGAYVGGLRKTLALVRSWIIGFSNLAGEEKEFQICSSACSDFVMSVGPCRGTMGVMMLSCSYKGSLTITITAKEGILDKSQVQNLALLIKEEVSVLLGDEEHQVQDKEVCSLEQFLIA